MSMKRTTVIRLSQVEVCSILSEYLNNKYDDLNIQPSDIQLKTCAYKNRCGELIADFSEATVTKVESED